MTTIYSYDKYKQSLNLISALMDVESNVTV